MHVPTAALPGYVTWVLLFWSGGSVDFLALRNAHIIEPFDDHH